MSIAYIGIGSNLGNREENCLKAIKLLADKGLVIKKRSSIYETEPWGVNEQPRFINMAIETETSLEPEKLLEVLKNTEQEMGRQDSRRWSSRVIDLDILLYDDIVANTPFLQIPHLLMHTRDFVLKPMSEIAPDMVQPVLGKTIRNLFSELKANEMQGTTLRIDGSQ